MDIFKEGKFELLVLTETKLKGNGEISWCGVHGIITGERCAERCVTRSIDRLWINSRIHPD